MVTLGSFLITHLQQCNLNFVLWRKKLFLTHHYSAVGLLIEYFCVTYAFNNSLHTHKKKEEWKNTLFCGYKGNVSKENWNPDQK